MNRTPYITAALLAVVIPAIASSTDLPSHNGQLYMPGRIIVAFEANSAAPAAEGVSTGFPWLDATLFPAGLTDWRQIYPQLESSTRTGARELSRIWEFFLDKNANVPFLCDLLATLPEIAWTEPRWALPFHESRTPDDPLLPSQYHLDILECEQAWWWASAASPTAIVGIIDSGVMYDHPDLEPNMWVNPGEDLNGNGVVDPSDWNELDDDGNGFVDDFWGWDWVDVGQSAVWPGEDGEDPDNDPSDFDGHGTHCAGDASERCHNTLGGGGVGWGVRIMALRTGFMAANGMGYNSYYNEGTIYAANNGADVISMSFGGPGYSAYTQQVLDYAYGLGVVNVAAAGNESSQAYSYPAAYNHVISVGATDQLDQMADFSNYGSWVDIYAPGVGILSTTNNGGYGVMGGTSMACPITAGAAALLKALYPDLTGDEVNVRLLLTADSIQTGNPNWPEALRLNAGAACDWVCGAVSFEINDEDSSGRFSAGESAEMVVTLANHTSEFRAYVEAEIISDDPDLTVTSGLVEFGHLDVGTEVSNAAAPFTLSLSPDFEEYRSAELSLHVTDINNYDYTQIIEIPLGRGDILIVNGDQEQDEEVYYYYTVALDNLTNTWEVWDVLRSGIPDAVELSYYPTLIWYTGTALEDVLPPEATAALTGYLGAGGRLLLSGQNIARDLDERSDPFLGEYLGCSFVEDNAADYSLVGLESDPIAAGMSFIILGSGGAENQDSPDVVEANASGQAMILYSLSEPVRQAGVHSDARGAVVFLPFGFEAINDSASSYTNRTTFMASILDWFQQYGVADENGAILPVEYSLGQNYPNPFNAETIIPLELPQRSRVKIELYNIRGQNLGKIYEGIENAGWSKIRYNASRLASGVYFYKIMAVGLERGGKFTDVGKMLLLK